MPPPAASAGPGGWEEEEEMFLLGHVPKELLTAKYRRCKGFAKKDGRGFKIPQIFYQEMILKCSTPHLDATCAG